MSAPDAVAAEAARILLDIDAVLIRPDDPFTLTSGRLSPVYVDCRRIIGFPRARARLMTMMVEQLDGAAGPEAFDVVAGGETAGIPFAAWAAERMGLPMAYIRKKPKGFGRNALIEGVVKPGDRALLVEDLMTDGGSKIHFIEALRGAGATAADIAVMFRYGLAHEARGELGEMGCRIHGLTTWPELLAFAEEDDRIAADVADHVRAFLRDPEGWSAARAG